MLQGLRTQLVATNKTPRMAATLVMCCGPRAQPARDDDVIALENYMYQRGRLILFGDNENMFCLPGRLEKSLNSDYV